jgi:hypothetical protein
LFTRPTLRELKLRSVDAIETVKPQMLKSNWKESEHSLDIAGAMKLLALILQAMKHFDLH